MLFNPYRKRERGRGLKATRDTKITISLWSRFFEPKGVEETARVALRAKRRYGKAV